MIQELTDNVHRTMRHALDVEEKIPVEDVIDFHDVRETPFI